MVLHILSYSIERLGLYASAALSKIGFMPLSGKNYLIAH
jgi:hypothetical protein